MRSVNFSKVAGFTPPWVFFTFLKLYKCNQIAQRTTNKQRFFSTQPQCCLTFSWIDLQMSLMCCLLHETIIILRCISYLVYLCPFVGIGLLYICDLFFIFSIIFIVINHTTSFKQTYLFYVIFLEYLPLSLDDNENEVSE